MIKLSIKQYRKYKDIIDSNENDLCRNILPDELAVLTGLDAEQARDMIDFVKEDYALPDNENEYQLIIRRGIGNNELKKIRLKKNLSQKELAEKTGISDQIICGMENCRIYPTELQRKTLSNFFGVNEGTLFPEWLKWLADEIKNSVNEKVVEIGMLRLDSPDVLSLTDGQHDIERIEAQRFYRDKIEPMLNNLTPRELTILRYRKGFPDGDSHTLEESGKYFGVSRERIKQIEEKALDKLRDGLKKQ